MYFKDLILIILFTMSFTIICLTATAPITQLAATNMAMIALFVLLDTGGDEW